ncbi:rRNA biogenesis protein RRP5 [Geosmithia morbida]|uniref:rRNA biogenesis protein RRP5 n=1 Tax=Geosmithia morbida TaxID=1094350 RepID=A0A9P4YRB0_9HYPO|nr:rRNA biogenesis protein RRP5 [Geosmithia morbida]KAF4120354.1 rRNA biogenesis protein RRP5 [Geosmithia morbida]
MSTLKRKDAPGGERPEKKAKKTKDISSSSRDAKPSTTKPAADKPKSVVSILKDEEPMFPRGGGSVLTPLEQRQIQLDAKADAMHEDEFDTATKGAKKKKTKAAAKSAKTTGSKKADEDSVKVESLSFKKLVKGSLVLGQISRINPLDVEVTLPNNLIGHVSIVAISEQLTGKLERAAADDDTEEEDEDADDANVDLASFFTIGQYVRVYVVSTMDEAATSGKGRRKIELSMRPTEANAGMGMDELVANTTVMASVISVEDHGCVMDIGIPNVRAFLPKGEIDPATIAEDRLQTGAVLLCSVTGKVSSGKVAQLSLLDKRLRNVKAVPSEATTINTYLPGTCADILVTNTDRRGLAGKIMGHVDATADLIHSGVGPSGVDLDSTYKIATKVKARIICTFPTAKEPKLGISLLPHISTLGRKLPNKSKKTPTEVLPISSLVEKCTVKHVETEIGLFVDIGVPDLSGFVHISRVKDGKVDALFESSGPYKKGSVHQGRVVGYNEMDGLFHLSFEKTVLEQPFIRLEDVPIGEVVNCEVEKLVIDGEGVSGLILKVAEGITGFVTERHLADVHLQHPEKKFREGMKVKARVLSTDPPKRRMKLTMKKTLVNSEAPIIKSYDDVSVGMQVPGTIIKIQSNGAHIQFYGNLKGFLPVGEMSEAYIRDPNEHFRLGQVVSVHVLDVDPELRRLVVSCKDPAAFGLDKQAALKKLQVGDLVNGKVTQKTEDQVYVELADGGLKAMLPVGHLTDKSMSKNQFAMKRINVGQSLSELMVIEKDDKRRVIILTQKHSLVDASKNKKLLTTFEDAKVGAIVSGFVRNITQTAVFVQFGAHLLALLPKSRLPAETHTKSDFGFHKNQSIEVKIISVIPDLHRIMVALPSATDDEEPTSKKASHKAAPAPDDNLTEGSITKVKVSSIKETQMNVQVLNSEVQGRIDISQVFDSWDEIDNAKEPLTKFHRGQVLRAKVLGVHDAKDHRFLPISHRSTHSTLEFTVKDSLLKASGASEPLSLEQIKVGDQHIAFVNNVTPAFLWANLSPKVRGRISAMDASNDLSLLSDLPGNFPPGCALKVRVTAVDADNSRLDLSARSANAAAAITWDSLRPNMTLPGRVTKVNDRQVLVNLSDTVSGPVHLPDMADRYDDVNTLKYRKNDIVRVSVVEVDSSNKRLRLSMRPSRILSSASTVTDREITDFSQVHSGDIVRGFVKNVSDKGLFVLLGGQVTGLVKIANLSDRFLKNWKDEFQVDQLVKGRVLSVEAATRQLELSLKSSALDEDYTPPVTLAELKEGQVVTGRVRKVEDFGAFILVDNSANISGLCHRSQMAEKPVEDATKLYKEGDVVKAIILSIDAKKKRISFGLKPSFFDDEDEDMDSDNDGALLEDGSDDEDSDAEMADGGAALQILGTDNQMDTDDDEDEDDDEGDDEGDDDDDEPSTPNGLGAGKKSAWLADPFAEEEEASSGSDDDDGDDDDDKKSSSKKKKGGSKKSSAEVDRTADLDAKGPQAASDYERLLLDHPDSSELWIEFMIFQMQVGDLSKAREVAEKAVQSINMKEEASKLNMWGAYLNLEVQYGNKKTVEDVFRRACQVNDEQEVYERLASTYIQSGKLKEADALFENMVKKFGYKSPNVWINYAHFLHVTMNDVKRARSLLGRSQQQHGADNVNLISRFAALEFRSPNGEPERGRTMFEGMLATWPKKGDLWSQLLDLEMGIAEDDQRGGGDLTPVRDVFERRTRVKGLKPKQAESWFRRWAAWEGKRDAKGKEKIMAKAQEWVVGHKLRKDVEAAAAAAAADMEEE